MQPRPRVESTRAALTAKAVAVVEASRPSASVVPARASKGPPAVALRRRISERAPLRVALVGDSVAYSVLPTLQSTADELTSKHGLPYVAVGGFAGPGFGLTADVPGHNDIGPTAPASAYANWQTSLRRLVDESDPDVVLVLLGVWDTIERDPGGRRLAPGMPQWRDWYGLLASGFTKTVTARGAALVWLVMPCVGRPDLNARLTTVNGVLHDTWRAAPGHVAFVNLGAAVCRNGAPIYQVPSPLGPLTVREADGIHFRPLEAPYVLRPFLVRRFTALLRAAGLAAVHPEVR